VIQAGGEDGMWTFERYQRWIDQHTEWVRPAALSADVLAEASVPTDIRAPARPVNAPPRPTPSRPVEPKPARGAASPPPPDQPIEISIDEDADLSELAKRIERRTR
jgi:hypothetical protein